MKQKTQATSSVQVSKAVIPNPSEQKTHAVRHMVLKGGLENISHDANMMAEIENEKSRMEELQKKSRMESFLNSTKLNATKLSKQNSQKNHQHQQNKKIYLEKQRDLKSKYTILKKTDKNFFDSSSTDACDEVKPVKHTATKVEWKKTSGPHKQNQNPENRVEIIPAEKLHYEDSDNDRSDADSVIDSDVDGGHGSNPLDMLESRENVRFCMSNKSTNAKVNR